MKAGGRLAHHLNGDGRIKTFLRCYLMILVRMLYVTANRDDMLSWLPKGSAIAEVGVFAGAFSRQILDICQPRSLHLIDLWKWTYFDWDNPPAKELRNIEGFKAWAKGVDPPYDGGHPDMMLDRFHAKLVALSNADRRVSVHKGDSVPVAATLPDASLDCVYLDADHHYDSVLADLFAYAPKVNRSGIIWGDDFLDDESRLDGLYGVIQAVDTFCKRGEFKPLCVVGPSACQYVIYRQMSPYVDEFLTNLINSGKHIIELNDSTVGRFYQRTLRTTKTERGFIASFA